MSLVEVRELVKAAGQELDELREHVEASDDALVKDIVSTINEICVTKEYLAGVEEKIQEHLDSTHTAYQNQFNEITEQTTSLKDDIKGAKKEIEAVNSRVDSATVANLLLKDDIRNVKQEIELTNSRINEVIDSNKTLEERIETVDARVDELSIANISLKGDIGDVKQEVEKTNSRIDGVNAVTSAIQTDIYNVKQEVGNVNSRVDDIDSKIACMKEYVTLLAQIYSQMSKHL
jgi:chromosome segregation ATPase